MFNATSGVVMIGEMTDDTGEQVVRFTRPWDPWFYLCALSKIRSCDGETEGYTPLVDYLFRYDRGCFWTGKLAFEYFLTPFNRFTRFYLGLFHACSCCIPCCSCGWFKPAIHCARCYLSLKPRSKVFLPSFIKSPLMIGRIGLVPSA